MGGRARRGQPTQGEYQAAQQAKIVGRHRSENGEPEVGGWKLRNKRKDQRHTTGRGRAAITSPSHSRGGSRASYPIGLVQIAFHGGKIVVHRPRVHDYDGHEIARPTRMRRRLRIGLAGQMNLMLISVSKRRFTRSDRLPEGAGPAAAGDATSKSSASRQPQVGALLDLGYSADDDALTEASDEVLYPMCPLDLMP